MARYLSTSCCFLNAVDKSGAVVFSCLPLRGSPALAGQPYPKFPEPGQGSSAARLGWGRLCCRAAGEGRVWTSCPARPLGPKAGGPAAAAGHWSECGGPGTPRSQVKRPSLPLPGQTRPPSSKSRAFFPGMGAQVSGGAGSGEQVPVTGCPGHRPCSVLVAVQLEHNSRPTSVVTSASVSFPCLYMGCSRGR